MRKSLRIVVAGGGTGGHIFPAIAIANAIKSKNGDAEFLFVGARGKMEMEKVPQAGFKIKGLTIAGYNRSSLIKNVMLPLKLFKSFFEVAGIFKEFQPHAVIGVGGYSSFPVLKYAQTKRIPTFIHESNSFAGKSNIFLAKNATKIFTATGGMEKFFPSSKIVVTGNPVRRNIFNMDIPIDVAKQFFGLDPKKITILSIGGSLGAKSINEAVLRGLAEIKENHLQLIWQTGKGFYETAANAISSESGIFVSDFIKEMEYAYAAADVVISRSGAMATAELCIAGKPVVFVPYPFAAEDHQTANALNLVSKDAALLVTDRDAAENLVKETVALAKDKSRQERLIKNIKEQAIINADEKIADIILEHLNG